MPVIVCQHKTRNALASGSSPAGDKLMQALESVFSANPPRAHPILLWKEDVVQE